MEWGCFASLAVSIAISALFLIIYFRYRAFPASPSVAKIAKLPEFGEQTLSLRWHKLIAVRFAVDLPIGIAYALAPFVMLFAHQVGSLFCLLFSWY